jgi:hypothetical protein
MRSTLPFLLAGAALTAACGGPLPPPFKAVVDNKLLMQSTIDPNASVIWDAVKQIITKDGTEDIRPRTEEQWAEVRHAAVTLAESGNLLMLVPRAKDGDEWMKRAQELITTGEAAIRAADARNADQLFTVGGDIYDACTNCHKKYSPAVVTAIK